MIGAWSTIMNRPSFKLNAAGLVGVVRVAVEELAVGRVDLAFLDLDLALGKGRVEVGAVLLVGCRRGGDAEAVEVDPMDGHFVAGMSLVVAEPLMVAHVELAGRNPHEAGDGTGLGMLAGLGLQAGRGRVGRPCVGGLDGTPRPRALSPVLRFGLRTWAAFLAWAGRPPVAGPILRTIFAIALAGC